LAGIRDPDQREGRMKTKDRVTKEKNIGCWRTWVFFWMSFSFSFQTKRERRKKKPLIQKKTIPCSASHADVFLLVDELGLAQGLFSTFERKRPVSLKIISSLCQTLFVFPLVKTISSP
jgi:hypothetical protein